MWQMAFTMLTDIALPGIDLQYLSRDNKELSVLRHGTLNRKSPFQPLNNQQTVFTKLMGEILWAFSYLEENATASS